MLVAGGESVYGARSDAAAFSGELRWSESRDSFRGGVDGLF